MSEFDKKLVRLTKAAKKKIDDAAELSDMHKAIGSWADKAYELTRYTDDPVERERQREAIRAGRAALQEYREARQQQRRAEREAESARLQREIRDSQPRPGTWEHELAVSRARMNEPVRVGKRVLR